MPKKGIKCGRKQMKIYFDYARAKKKERAVLIEIKKEEVKKKVEAKRSSYPLTYLFYILSVI